MPHKGYIFIITARGGSVRLPNKNMKLFCGKPLICWTIMQALRFAKYGKVVVTSDDNKILKITKKFKNLYSIKRPKYLSKNNSSSIEVVRHVLKKFKDEESVILLQPTSPLRKDKDIKVAISHLDKGKQAVMSQTKLQYSIDKININKSDNFFYPLDLKKNSLYAPNGAVFGATKEWLLKNDTFFDPSVYTFDMPISRAIDIDYLNDFILAETIFKKNY